MYFLTIRSALISYLFSFSLWLQAAPPPTGHGVYAIWYHDHYDYLNVPYIAGGQVVVQWADVDKGEGQYDFSSIAEEIHKLNAMGKKTTVQINGNKKPAWLFDKVPCYPGKLSIQVRDSQGTLMYWHPVFLNAYINMLKAFAAFMAQSPDWRAAIGVRLNFDAIGTEHGIVSKEAQDLSKWKIPPGGTPGTPWSPEKFEAYQQAVVDTYVNCLSPYMKIFVRNSISNKLEEQYRQAFQSGKLGWFHTSSEAEPRSTSGENGCLRFYQDCRSGKTVAYAEPWASAWGVHDSKVDDRPISPPQWNYWRLLFDLNCGVSYVAVYAVDLSVAVNGTYLEGKRGRYDEQKDRRGYQREFEAAFRFAAKYAGYHASPEESPGAWVAFRENYKSLAANVPNENNRQLNFFTNDYTFLMQRLPDKSMGVCKVGPENQRQGAWARLLPAGERMQLQVDKHFAASFKGGKVMVTYLERSEDAGNTFDILAVGARKTVTVGNSGRWQTAELALPDAPLAPFENGAHLQITAGARPVCLHMVEVQ